MQGGSRTSPCFCPSDPAFDLSAWLGSSAPAPSATRQTASATCLPSDGDVFHGSHNSEQVADASV